MNEIKNILYIVSKEKMTALVGKGLPLNEVGPVWGSEANQEDKDKVAKLSQELSLDRKKKK